VDADDRIRDGVMAESLAKLKPAFTKDECTHAGKCLFLMLCVGVPLLILCSAMHPQVFDGASAVLLARRSIPRRLGLPMHQKICRRCSSTHNGCRPSIRHPSLA
jgi:acetyl-CoA acyltransferase 1